MPWAMSALTVASPAVIRTAASADGFTDCFFGCLGIGLAASGRRGARVVQIGGILSSPPCLIVRRPHTIRWVPKPDGKGSIARIAAVAAAEMAGEETLDRAHEG